MFIITNYKITKILEDLCFSHFANILPERGSWSAGASIFRSPFSVLRFPYFLTFLFSHFPKTNGAKAQENSWHFLIRKLKQILDVLFF